MKVPQEFDERLKDAASKLDRFTGHERARREDLISRVRREIIMIETSKTDHGAFKAEERAEGYLNQLEETR